MEVNTNHTHAEPWALRQPLLRLRDAARLLDLNPATLRKLANAGQIPGALRVGKSWRFDLSRLTQ